MGYLDEKFADINKFMSAIDEITINVTPTNISRVRLCLAELFQGSEATLDEFGRIQNLRPTATSSVGSVWSWTTDTDLGVTILEDRDTGFTIKAERSEEMVPWNVILTLSNITQGGLYWNKYGTGIHRLLGQGVQFSINRIANAA